MDNDGFDGAARLPDVWEGLRIPLVDPATALAANSRALRRLSEQLDERAVR
jgi:hypothetical protein